MVSKQKKGLVCIPYVLLLQIFVFEANTYIANKPVDHYISARNAYEHNLNNESGPSSRAPAATAESANRPAIDQPRAVPTTEEAPPSLQEVLTSAAQRQVERERRDGTLIDPHDTVTVGNSPQPAPPTLTRRLIARPTKGLTMFTPNWNFAEAEQDFDKRTTPVKATIPQRPDTRLALDNCNTMQGTLMPCLECCLTNEADPQHARHSVGTMIQPSEVQLPAFVFINRNDLAYVLNVFHFLHGGEKTVIIHDVTESVTNMQQSNRTLKQIVAFIYSETMKRAREYIKEWTVEIPMGAGVFLVHSLPEPLIRKSFLVQYVDQRSPIKNAICKEVIDLRRCMEEHVRKEEFIMHPNIDLSPEQAVSPILRPLSGISEDCYTLVEGSNNISNVPNIRVADTSVKEGKKPAKFWSNPDSQEENRRVPVGSVGSFDLTLSDVALEEYPETRPILPLSRENIEQVIFPNTFSFIVNPWKDAFERRCKVVEPFKKEINNFAGRLYFERELVENCYIEIDELSKGLNRQIQLQKKNIKTTGQIRVLRLDCNKVNMGKDVPKIDNPRDARFVRYRFGTFHGDTTLVVIGFLVELLDWYETYTYQECRFMLIIFCV